MRSRSWVIAVLTLALAWVVGVGCTNTRDIAGRLDTEAGVDPAFTSPDAAVADTDGSLLQYCPATACQGTYTTCPGSRFPCDANLMNDPNNCGSCGFECPADSFGLAAKFSCVEGKCAMSCASRDDLDCNGELDDGCETPLGTNDDCNACGDKCLDPNKPCMWDPVGKSGTCGCKDPKLTHCSSCVDLKTADTDCGACGNSCPSTGDGGVTPPNSYFGCVDSECGHLKCNTGRGDCDGNPDNGCEADLFATTSCGACGVVCDPGQTCAADEYGRPACMCPPGMTFCSDHCVNVGTDPFNCGGCDVDCTKATNEHAAGLCNYGSCTLGCVQGWGDCNANPKDGCETNFDSDPRNCGGCGNACDLLTGQPCIAGRCAVEPCGPGGPTK
jgi:hypothetical protein